MTSCHPPNYPPFGSSLPNRAWNDGNRGYRFGFNGKEKDSETASDNFDFGARIYDGRLGRWLSLDPYSLFSGSNYKALNSSPIVVIDKNGERDFYNQSGNWIGTDGNETTKTEIYIITDNKLAKKIIKSSKLGTNWVSEIPNGLFYSLPEKSVIDAVIAVQTASDAPVLASDDPTKILIPAGEHESALVFDDKMKSSGIINGEQIDDKNCKASAEIPFNESVQYNYSIHNHPILNNIDHLNSEVCFSEIGPSEEDKITFKYFKTNIIIGQNRPINPNNSDENIGIKLEVYFYNSEAILSKSVDYEALKLINSEKGKTDSEIYKKYNEKNDLDKTNENIND